MLIDIRGIRDELLRKHVARRLDGVLARLSMRPVGVQVLFSDENGPKGGVDVRCALTVRLPYRPSVRVEHMGETPRRAVDPAFAILGRQLERYIERDRDRKRRPKKYFAARRLLVATGRWPAPAGGGQPKRDGE